MISQDIRYSLRNLRRSPGFTIVALLVLALGIGATSAVFSIVNGVLLAPLPWTGAERIVHLGGQMTRDSAEIDWPLSPLDIAAVSSVDRAFEAVAVVSNLRSFNVSSQQEAEHVNGELVGADFFAVFSMRPAAGRFFTAEEALPGSAAQVVVVSWDFWQRHFGADPGAVGRSLTLNDQPFEVIGVAPRGFNGLSDEASVWAPMGLAGRLYNQPAYLEMRQFRWAQGLARLREGVGLEVAQELVNAHSLAMREQHPAENRGLRIGLTPLTEMVRGSLRGPLFALLAAAAFVLLIACTNVANLLLARGAARDRELAVRYALGAGTGRIVRQLVTETLVLGAAGGAAGLLLAGWLVRLLLRFGALDVTTWLDVGLDWRVVAVTLVASLGAALAFGVLPAVLAVRGAPHDVLREGSRGSKGGTGRRRFQSALIGADVALALVLLVGAGLTTRGFGRFMNQDLGYDPANVLTMRLDYSAPRFATAEAVQPLFRQLVERARAVPGVAAAALEGPGYPTSGSYAINLDPADRPIEPGGAPQSRRHNVSPGYFATLGIPLVSGRGITDEDVPNGPRVVVLSRRLAERLFPGQDPLGRQVMPNGNRELLLTVVGVAGDVRHAGPDLDADNFADSYFAAAQFPPRNPSLAALIVRTSGTDPMSLVQPLTAMISDVAPGLSPYSVGTIAGHVAADNADGRFLVFLMTAFAGVALVLAAVGIYGVIAYTVGQRTREIGIRIALGAERARVMRLVLRRALVPVVAGLAAGIVGAALLSRVARSLLYGLSPFDPFTFAAMVIVIGTAAVLAGLVPARRATRIDPMVALRAD